MTTNPPATIALLMTGDELMRGDTVDSNSAKIASALAETGVVVQEKATVGDDRQRLSAAIARLAEDHAVLIVNGGLGPTSDDLTAEVIAQLAGIALVEHAKARTHVEDWCARRGITANDANLKQAFMPLGAQLIHNPRGSALGFAVDLGHCRVITTPGVPSELMAMLPEVLALTSERVATHSVHTLRLQTFGMGESSIQQAINDSGYAWPAQVALGFRAGLPQLELKLTVNDDAHIPLQRACLDHLQALMGDHIIGEASTTLAQALAHALREQHKTVTTAESCTGGLIAAMITREPGSSDIFQAGYVTYANDIKHRTLGVSLDDLDHHGAVSEAVVRQMLVGALAHSGADMGIAVSGIAGPGGGSEEKPVGTVWLAWGSSDIMHTRRVVIPGPRDDVQQLVAAAGLDLVRRQLLGLPTEPQYFSRQAQ